MWPNEFLRNVANWEGSEIKLAISKSAQKYFRPVHMKVKVKIRIRYKISYRMACAYNIWICHGTRAIGMSPPMTPFFRLILVKIVKNDRK